MRSCAIIFAVAVFGMVVASPAARAAAPATAPTADDVLVAAAEPALSRFLDAIRHADADMAVGEVDPAALAERTFGAEELQRIGASSAAEVTTAIARAFAGIMCDPKQAIRRWSPPRPVLVTVDALELDVDVEPVGYPTLTLRVAMRRTSGEWRVADVGHVRGDSICTMLGKVFAREKSRGVTAKQFAAKQAEASRDAAIPPHATTTTAPATPLERRDTTQYATATDAVRAYLELLRAGRIEDAVDTFWDVNRMLEKMFESDFASMPEEDRLVGAQLLRRRLLRIFTPDKSFYAAARLEEITARERSDDTTDVAIHLRTGEREIGPRLILTRGADGWKIFNARSQGQSMVDDTRRAYAGVRAGLTPIKFLIGVVEEPPATQTAKP